MSFCKLAAHAQMYLNFKVNGEWAVCSAPLNQNHCTKPLFQSCVKPDYSYNGDILTFEYSLLDERNSTIGIA